jgi:3-oxoacyl-[acyl-carrier-protein] synthase-3
MQKILPLKIVGTGTYLPPTIETSADVGARIGRSAKWIESRTGVKTRHRSELPMEEMAAIAARQALGDGGTPDLILNASGVPRQTVPDSSVYVQRALGWEGIPSFTIHATCISFVVALHTAAHFLAMGTYKRILIVSADRGTVGRNFEQPESASLLGDAAAAVVVESPGDGEENGILGFKLESYPSGADFTTIKGGGTYLHPNDPAVTPADNLFQMHGTRVFRMARKIMPEFCRSHYRDLGLKVEDYALCIPHQTSKRGVLAYKFADFTEDNIFSMVESVGNTVGTAIPLALVTAADRGRVKRGDLVFLVGTGAGLSCVGLTLRW